MYGAMVSGGRASTSPFSTGGGGQALHFPDEVMFFKLCSPNQVMGGIAPIVSLHCLFHKWQEGMRISCIKTHQAEFWLPVRVSCLISTGDWDGTQESAWWSAWTHKLRTTSSRPHHCTPPKVWCFTPTSVHRNCSAMLGQLRSGSQLRCKILNLAKKNCKGSRRIQNGRQQSKKKQPEEKNLCGKPRHQGKNCYFVKKPDKCNCTCSISFSKFKLLNFLTFVKKRGQFCALKQKVSFFFENKKGVGEIQPKQIRPFGFASPWGGDNSTVAYSKLTWKRQVLFLFWRLMNSGLLPLFCRSQQVIFQISKTEEIHSVSCLAKKKRMRDKCCVFLSLNPVKIAWDNFYPHNLWMTCLHNARILRKTWHFCPVAMEKYLPLVQKTDICLFYFWITAYFP